MALELDTLCIDAHDPAGLARFWGGLLGREVSGVDPTVLPQVDEPGFAIRFLPTRVPKDRPNQMHPDLTSTSLADQQARVARALELGGGHLDIGQGPDADHVVLADPEGNELCVIPPGNRFLAGCPVVGALASDGTRAVGCFWSRALAWPLVWDEGEETAIQSPLGGSKISWGGPPVAPKAPRNRWHLDLVPSHGSDRDAEVERLLGLGASRLEGVAAEAARHDPVAVVLADPDGNEFCVGR